MWHTDHEMVTTNPQVDKDGNKLPSVVTVLLALTVKFAVSSLFLFFISFLFYGGDFFRKNKIKDKTNCTVSTVFALGSHLSIFVRRLWNKGRNINLLKEKKEVI